ncbi:FRG domain-containing protein [Aeromonas veronii]
MWSSIYDEVLDVMGAFNSDVLFFRGHGDPSWQLTPNINRFKYKKTLNLEALEGITFFDYKTRSGNLLERNSSSWDVAFSMQHHGLPTRLLDWSESFAVALYFALKGSARKTELLCMDHESI